MSVLGRRAAVWVFLPFAAAYFLAALLRAVTATLAPTLAEAFSLGAADLGLLSGGYFLGFAITQLPLGHWLDRHGPRRVLLSFLGMAVLGCGVFALATGFTGLLVGRVLFGAGVSACLMAPLTGFRRWYSPAAQLRANAWMLMTGSLGMVASTLPVQWLLPVMGWRALFWGIAAMVLLSGAWIALAVPGWNRPLPAAQWLPADHDTSGYAVVWRHPYFRRVAPMGFFTYGGMVAMQTLWAGPWMQRVAHYSELEAATGLFWINVSMLCTFGAWGLLGPWMARHRIDVNRVMAGGLPFSLCVLLAILVMGALLRFVHCHGAVAAGGGCGLRRPRGGTGSVCLQPGGVWGRLCAAVGHRTRGRWVPGRGPGCARGLPRRAGAVSAVQPARLAVVSAQAGAAIMFLLRAQLPFA